MRILFRSVVVASFTLLGISFAGGAIAAKAAAKKEIVQWNLPDLKWHAVPNTPGGEEVVAYKKGTMTCRFFKFPKGTEVPLHTHSHDIFGVVVAGAFGSTDAAGNGKPQPVGGFQSIPGGLKHTTKCTDDADCVVFSCQPGPFDIKMDKAVAGGKKEAGQK